jgi:uncharacterized protein (TIGR00255 family)
MKSMTGYGKAVFIDDRVSLKVELKSTNSRYLDLQFNLPSELRALESGIRQKIADILKRGRIDCYIYIEKYYKGSKIITINKDLLEQLLNELNEIPDNTNIKKEIRMDSLLSIPGIIETESEAEDIPKWLIEILDSTLAKALAEVDVMRISEGMRLKETVSENIELLAENVSNIKKETESINEGLVEKYRARLKKYANEVEMDENRLSMEASIAAERSDVSEEIARLESHINEIQSCINMNNEPIGKRLDFLLQEMSREANTLNAKTAGMQVNLMGVEM